MHILTRFLFQGGLNSVHLSPSISRTIYVNVMHEIWKAGRIYSVYITLISIDCIYLYLHPYIPHREGGPEMYMYDRQMDSYKNYVENTITNPLDR